MRDGRSGHVQPLRGGILPPQQHDEGRDWCDGGLETHRDLPPELSDELAGAVYQAGRPYSAGASHSGVRSGAIAVLASRRQRLAVAGGQTTIGSQAVRSVGGAMRVAILFVLLLAGCQQSPSYDLVIRHGTIYDGSGQPPRVADIAVTGDTIAAIAELDGSAGRQEIDARGLAVAPGFVNMLSWANESLIVDGRSQSDIRQGVTLEVMGEGDSMGPLNERMKTGEYRPPGRHQVPHRMDDSRRIPALPQESRRVAQCGIVCRGDHDPTPRNRLRESRSDAGRDGSHEGPGPPGDGRRRARGRILTHLRAGVLREHRRDSSSCAVWLPSTRMYISHMRNEGNALLEAVDELIRIACRSGIAAEIYHLKAAGPRTGRRWMK